MTTVTIWLPESLRAFINQQLATKGYGSVSEYFRSLLRDAQHAEEDAVWKGCFSKGWQRGTVFL